MNECPSVLCFGLGYRIASHRSRLVGCEVQRIYGCAHGLCSFLLLSLLIFQETVFFFVHKLSRGPQNNLTLTQNYSESERERMQYVYAFGLEETVLLGHVFPSF